ncbi:MAG: carbohydrate kinase family protein [Alistipes sp.]|nr:carbohydrate kinase family protein [Alistipes senegalensis]MCM1249622.1 carbohydrate kinase family protein [Alistipes sp.]
MKTFDITAIGELNVDLILNRIEGFPEIGKEKFAGDMLLTLGSSTAIFAANAAALGSRTAFAGMIGRDLFGEVVERSLREKKVDTRFLVKSDACATGATVVMSYDEDRANLTYQGAMDRLRLRDLDPALFEQTRHIHISSIFMQSGLRSDLEELLRTARDKGVTVSLDTQWDPTEEWALDYRQLLPLIDLFMPNEKELLALTRRSTLDDAIAEIKPCLGRAAIVKCGSRGSLLVRKEGAEHPLPAFLNRDVVDTIGAGDSFNSGFIHAFVQGRPLEECQRTGNLTGAVSTTAAGGTGAFADRETAIRTALDRFGEKLDL